MPCGTSYPYKDEMLGLHPSRGQCQVDVERAGSTAAGTGIRGSWARGWSSSSPASGRLSVTMPVDVFAAHRSSAPLVVKLLDTGLVRRLRRCAIDVQGLECMSLN